MKKCLYCDFLSGVYDADARKAYTLALCNEIKYFGQRTDEVIETVYIGGGTPSWLELSLMDKILSTVRQSFLLARDAEVTIECNPGTVRQESLSAYASMGINRISFGLQSANDDELALLGRVHNFSGFLRSYETALAIGFDDINVDIMTGLPGQTKEKLNRTLQKVLMIKPAHISAYDLMIEEGTPFYQKYHDDDVRRGRGEPTRALPSEDEAFELSRLTEDMLATHGYERYEISNFAKPNHRCRHNCGYWQRVPYIGVGLGAASFVGETRYANERDFYSYIAHAGSERKTEDGQVLPATVGEVTPLSKADAMAEFMFLGLRMTDGVTRDAFESMFGVTVDSVYGTVLRDLRMQGLLTEEFGRIALTRRGMEVANPVLAMFLPEE